MKTEASPILGINEEEPGPIVPCLRVQLNHGFTLLNIFTFFYATFANICALVFLNGSLPYLLTNFLNVPQDEQGNYVGNILLVNEITVLIFVSFWGIISDRIGRRLIYVLAFILMGGSIMLHPLASNFAELICIRIVFAIGAAASVSMLTAILSDYPTNEGKGRSAGVVGVMTGCGALLAAFVFLRIPSWVHWGLIGAGEVMYWSVGGYFILTGMYLFWGLSDQILESNKHENIVVIVKEGVLAASNPRIALSYLASFAARGDAIIITSFLSLWVNKFVIDEGKSNEDALAAAGTISGIAQTMALVAAPLFGIASDYVDRTLTQVIAAGIATGGYLWMFFLRDPTSVHARVAIAFVGLGEIGMIVTSQILVSSEAPPKVRGSVAGFFGLAGSVSILISTKIGGIMFDNWKESSPFLLVAFFNATVFFVGLAIYIRARIQASQHYEVQ